MHNNSEEHRALALWAADCAERVLPLFEAAQPGDKRPRAAIAGARAWARGTMAIAEARKRAFAAHAAAREAGSEAGRQAARAAGHAAATAHVPSHAPHAANYALKAVMAVGGDDVAEERWQDESLPLAR
ncbi:MAG: putative immunity protein [Devosia sp.]